MSLHEFRLARRAVVSYVRGPGDAERGICDACARHRPLALCSLCSVEGVVLETIDSVILLDVQGGAGHFERKVLEDMGHRVMVCHGPSHDSPCPVLVEGGSCDLVDAAHGVVFELDLDIEDHRNILRRYQVLVRPEIPMRVVVQESQAETYGDLLRGMEVWNHEPSTSELDAFSARVEAFERTTP